MQGETPQYHDIIKGGSRTHCHTQFTPRQQVDNIITMHGNVDMVLYTTSHIRLQHNDVVILLVRLGPRLYKIRLGPRLYKRNQILVVRGVVNRGDARPCDDTVHDLCARTLWTCTGQGVQACQ